MLAGDSTDWRSMRKIGWKYTEIRQKISLESENTASRIFRVVILLTDAETYKVDVLARFIPSQSHLACLLDDLLDVIPPNRAPYNNRTTTTTSLPCSPSLQQ